MAARRRPTTRRAGRRASGRRPGHQAATSRRSGRWRTVAAPSSAVAGEARGQLGIVDEPRDRLGHRLDVLGRHQQAGLPVGNALQVTEGRGCHDRAQRQLSLDDGVAERLAQGGATTMSARARIGQIGEQYRRRSPPGEIRLGRPLLQFARRTTRSRRRPTRPARSPLVALPAARPQPRAPDGAPYAGTAGRPPTAARDPTVRESRRRGRCAAPRCRSDGPFSADRVATSVMAIIVDLLITMTASASRSGAIRARRISRRSVLGLMQVADRRCRGRAGRPVATKAG